jgi:hypothetical protein
MGNATNKLVRINSFNVSGGNLPDGFSVVVAGNFDFTGCTQDELLGWSIQTLTIRLQSVLRKTSVEFLRELARTGWHGHARSCGERILTPEQRVAALVTVGVPLDVAELMVRNPDAAAKLLATLGGMKSK